MKVVINGCYGGFSLSKAAEAAFGREVDGRYCDDSFKFRADPKLVAVVESLGKAANGACAELRIVEIPDDVDWTIEEYDGVEWVAECHRTWS